LARPALAGGSVLFASVSQRSAPLVRRRPPRARREHWLVRLARRPTAGTCLALLVIAGGLIFGAVHGGQYAAFVEENGSPADILARFVGLGIDSVTITGARDLREEEILRAGGIGPKNSLLFLDVAEVRRNLIEKLPLVRDASVSKLYPNRLLVEIVEREPFALWQKDGRVVVVAADGTPIEDLRDSRFSDLPFVVGTGANERVTEYLKIIEAAGDLRKRIRAGIFVGQRRWDLKLNSGLDIRLPENEPDVALARLARLARESRLLDKDIVSIDLRVPGRAYVRLTEEAAAARAALFPKRKGKGPT
jgi:cell division protein FtsQ